MNDLISKSALVDRLSEEAKRLAEIAIHSKGQALDYYNGMKTGFAKAAIIANGLPTIEPKHGKWIFRNFENPYRWGCSECGNHVRARYNFCPNCGARMERSEE